MPLFKRRSSREQPSEDDGSARALAAIVERAEEIHLGDDIPEFPDLACKVALAQVVRVDDPSAAEDITAEDLQRSWNCARLGYGVRRAEYELLEVEDENPTLSAFMVRQRREQTFGEDWFATMMGTAATLMSADQADPERDREDVAAMLGSDIIGTGLRTAIIHRITLAFIAGPHQNPPTPVEPTGTQFVEAQASFRFGYWFAAAEAALPDTVRVMLNTPDDDHEGADLDSILQAAEDLGVGPSDEEVDAMIAAEGGPFVVAVSETRDALYDPDAPVLAENRTEFDHVRESARLAEAAMADGPARAFARAEIYPAGKGVGIFGPNLVHALGRQLNREIGRADGEQIDIATASILRALSFGYVGIMSLEPSIDAVVDAGTTPRDIWTLAVHNFRGDGLKTVGVDGPIVKHMESYATEALVAGLRAADLLGRRTPTKLQQLGRYYAHAGGYLRVAQTTWPVIRKAQLIAQALGDDHWPYDEYAV